jgi:hypothetical protein
VDVPPGVIGLRSGVQLHMSGLETSLLEQMLIEQRKQTELLKQIANNQMVLIQALAEEQGEDLDAMPLTYMDGSPCR